jgi:hypothetical protein
MLLLLCVGHASFVGDLARLSGEKWKRARWLQPQIVMSNYATRWFIIWRPSISPSRGKRLTKPNKLLYKCLLSLLLICSSPVWEPQPHKCGRLRSRTLGRNKCHKFLAMDLKLNARQQRSQARSCTTLLWTRAAKCLVAKEIGPSQLRAASGWAFDEQ